MKENITNTAFGAQLSNALEAKKNDVTSFV